MMSVISIGLLICLLYACFKWFIYYCFTRGVLHYLLDEYQDCLEEKKTKELISMAIERTIKEFFGRC